MLCDDYAAADGRVILDAVDQDDKMHPDDLCLVILDIYVDAITLVD